MGKGQTPKIYFRKSDFPTPDQPKARPRTPRNVYRRPPKLPRMEPITDAEREAA